MNDFSSEFAVAVFPLPLSRDRFHGVPVLGNLPVFNPPKIVKRGGLSSELSFADGQHKIPFAQYSVDLVEFQQPGDIPGSLMLEYYTQRVSDGGLIISEGTAISIASRGWFGAPGMYSDEQVAGWKKITAAVHAKGGRMFSQLWHTGRSSNVAMTNGAMPVAPSVLPAYWLDSKPSVSAPGGWVKPSPH